MNYHHHDGEFKTYDETFGLDRPNFTVDGQYSNSGQPNVKVYIYPDIKSGHDSQSPSNTYEHPTPYWLIPHIIANAPHYPSSSKDPRSLARAAEGHTEVYQLDNAFEMFNNDNMWGTNHSIVVPVFYPYGGKPNKALTVYDVWNPTKRQLG